MRASKARYRLWQVMLAVAILAGLFAVFGVIGSISVAVVLGVIFLPILLAGPGRRLRAAAWVGSIYPTRSLQVSLRSLDSPQRVHACWCVGEASSLRCCSSYSRLKSAQCSPAG